MIRATCAECHGLDISGDPNPTPESTAPPLSVVSAYSRAQFHHLLRTGEPVGGRKLGLMGMVARSRFSHLSDAEVNAIYDYLSAFSAQPD
jgi:cytochrome c553